MREMSSSLVQVGSSLICFDLGTLSYYRNDGNFQHVIKHLLGSIEVLSPEIVVL